MSRAGRQAIDEFLSLKRIAFVGVSRNPRDFSRTLFTELLRRGYDLVPVHPKAAEIEGRPCYAAVSDINPPVEAALVLTPSALAEPVVRDCAAAGVSHVWLHRGVGTGAVSPQAVDFCRTHGIQVVAGECPFMFLPGSGWFHRVHRFFRHLA